MADGLFADPDRVVLLVDVPAVWPPVVTLAEDVWGRASNPANAPTPTMAAAANQPVSRETRRSPWSRRLGAFMAPLSGFHQEMSAREPQSTPSSNQAKIPVKQYRRSAARAVAAGSLGWGDAR